MGFDPTFAELAGNPLPVGIECGRCLRRVLVGAAATQRRVSQARLHCSRCGSRTFTAQLFQTRAQATTFMKGYR